MTHKTPAEVGKKLPENLESVETRGESVAIESAAERWRFSCLPRTSRSSNVSARKPKTGSVPWETIKADLGL